jgi:hypothetical protein
MEQWGSDFSLDMEVKEDDAISRIAAAFAQPSDGGSYEAHLISVRDGKQVRHRFEQYTGLNWEHKEGGVSTWGDAEFWENIDENEGKRLNALIRGHVATILDERKNAEEKAALDKKNKEAKQKETYERQQLEALKQKYEGSK